jgi:hypothetical protein
VTVLEVSITFLRELWRQFLKLATHVQVGLSVLPAQAA